MQPAFVIIDENAGRDMHGIHQRQPFPNAAFSDACIDIIGDVDKFPALVNMEP